MFGNCRSIPIPPSQTFVPSTTTIPIRIPGLPSHHPILFPRPGQGVEVGIEHVPSLLIPIVNFPNSTRCWTLPSASPYGGDVVCMFVGLPNCCCCPPQTFSPFICVTPWLCVSYSADLGRRGFPSHLAPFRDGGMTKQGWGRVRAGGGLLAVWRHGGRRGRLAVLFV